jgi:L-aspartate oxidase
MNPLFDQRRYLIPFRSLLLPQIFTDTLVIGAGVAGLRAALAASENGDVIVLAKGDFKQSNTAWAQGGIAGVFAAQDSTQSHAEDTHVAGAELCDARAVDLVVQEGPRRIEELFGWGMQPDRDSAGNLSLGREGGHAANRIVHANGDATGAEIMRTLVERVQQAKAQGAPLRVFERCFALDLITAPVNGSGGVGGPAPVMGAITHHPRYGLQMIWAKATILAAGGAGMMYRETTNPPLATADGVAMAYRAGAELADMAFTQFHPTTLYLAGASRSLITEAIRGAGAYLLDAQGHRFMLGVHPLAELAPRDIVSRAIVHQIAAQGGGAVTLDCRHVQGFATSFPGITALLKKFNLDATKDLVPVHPAMHYMVGGVRTDMCGRTNVPGLYAAGEVACSGLHGANRLASNSLLEGLVFGAIAGAAAGEVKGNGAADLACERAARFGAPTTALAKHARFGVARPAPVHVVSEIPPSEAGELDIADVRTSLRSAMWKNVGIERTGTRLASMRDMLNFWANYTLDRVFDDLQGWEVQNMLLAASLVTASAEWRKESRGCHERTDCPGKRSEFAVHDVWVRGAQGPRAEAVDTPTESKAT